MSTAVAARPSANANRPTTASTTPVMMRVVKSSRAIDGRAGRSVDSVAPYAPAVAAAPGAGARAPGRRAAGRDFGGEQLVVVDVGNVDERAERATVLVVHGLVVARTTGEADLEARTALHEAAERDRGALTTLQAVTASLAGARTPVEVGDAILDRGLVALGAVAGGVSRVTDDGASVEVIAVRGYPDSEPGTIVALDPSRTCAMPSSRARACSSRTSTPGWPGTRPARLDHCRGCRPAAGSPCCP